MQTLHDIFGAAIIKEASDIHITVGKPVIFRIDGELIEVGTENLESSDVEELLYPLFQKDERLVNDFKANGEVDFAQTVGQGVRVRANVYREKGNMAAAIRILPDHIPTPEEIGLPSSVRELCNLRRGLVLVTGATGTGKSTTLASLIHTINQEHRRHIITLEDPIEYVHKHNKSVVNQRELGNDTLSYANALRAALRQDPDVILVGEMRDRDTIEVALTAAETGHLVFSTLHTNNAAATIDRIIDAFPLGQRDQVSVQLANVLEAVISQQLVPVKNDVGRVGAFEILLANPAVRNIIREGKAYQLPSQIQINKKMGMQTMDDALYKMYFEGTISADDCLHFAQDISTMTRRLIM